MRSALFGLSLSFALVSPLYASGQLDPRFDGDGIRIVETANTPTDTDRLHAGIIDRAGRYVGAGSGSVLFSTMAGTVVRMFPDGALDSGFGVGGIARVPELQGFANVSWVDIAEQDDGKLVLAGRAENASGPNDPGRIYVCRLMPNGALDAGFGSGGCIQPVFWHSSNIDNLAGMVQQPDGRIVLAGTSDVEGDGQPYEWIVARLENDGGFDLCFGDINCQGGGVLLAPEPPTDLPVFVPRAVALAPNGRIVLAGNATGVVGKDMAVVRLLPTGAVDVGGFGNGGHRLVGFDQAGTNFDEARSVVVRDDGSIVIAGIFTSAFGSLAGIAALDVTGTLINGFGTGGRVQLFFDDVSPDHIPTRIRQQDDGKLLVSGYTDSTNDGLEPFNCGIARLLPNGTLDPVFGIDGKLIVDGALGEDGDRPDRCDGLDSDGRSIVMFGWHRPVDEDIDSMLIVLEQDGLFRDGFEP